MNVQWHQPVKLLHFFLVLLSAIVVGSVLSLKISDSFLQEDQDVSDLGMLVIIGDINIY